MTEKPFNEMNNFEKRDYKNKLKEEGNGYCVGPLCNGVVKPLTEFHKNNYRECIECRKHHDTIHYKIQGKAYRREKTRLKMDQKCIECGCDDIELLEFDHIEPEKKTLNIGRSSSAKKIIKEAELTKFLCVWCHRLRTFKDTVEKIKKSQEDYEYTEEENNEEIIVGCSKTCNGPLCKGKKRNHERFYKSKNKYNAYCKKCHNFNDMIKRRKNAKIIDNEKLKIGKCNECHKEVTDETLCGFDFDHLDQTTKLYTIASLRQSTKNIVDIIKAEIKKCQLLCCNCHKKKTVEQLGYHKQDKETFAKVEHIKIKEKQVHLCPKCNGKRDRDAKFCYKCMSKGNRTVARPEFEILEDEIAKEGYVSTAKKYGVSDNTIRKWIRYYIKYENKQVTKIKITL